METTKVDQPLVHTLRIPLGIITAHLKKLKHSITIIKDMFVINPPPAFHFIAFEGQQTPSEWHEQGPQLWQRAVISESVSATKNNIEEMRVTHRRSITNQL